MMRKKCILPMFFCLVLFSCGSEGDQENGQVTTHDESVKDTTIVLTAYNAKPERQIQVFEINPNKKEEVKGKQGTVVTFPSGCFGQVEGTVKIELIECYSIQDMIFNGLSTQTTDGKPLESDGMIYLNALSETGDTLKITQGKVNIKMPTEQRKEDIRIFEGVENNNTVTWNLSNEKLIAENSNPREEEIKQSSNQDEKETLEEIVYIDKQDSIKHTQPKTSQPQIAINKQIKNESLVTYTFMIGGKMGWFNCDRYLEDEFGETKDLLVNVEKEQENVSLYLILDNYNSVMKPPYADAYGNQSKVKNGQLKYSLIPVSDPLTLVALATKGDKIYFGMANYPTHGEAINCPELTPITRQELTDLLLKKFGKDIWSRPLA